jgi:hypothetical protein
MRRGIILLAYLFFVSITLFAQNETSTISQHKGTFFVDFYAGTQVSGIRKEDYVSSNFAPYYQLSLGKWIVPYLAVSINYQGPYFHYISDNFKHKYFYIDGQVILDINSLFKTQYKALNIQVIAGGGLFYNLFYDRPNVCGTIGLLNEFKVTKTVSFKLKLASIMGWDIYQNDEDILTNLSLGLSIAF